jgi:thymidylate synthase ThyX
MKTLADIVHTEVPVEGGGMVLVLETGATIDPEAAAMLGALHSRSIGGIRSHLQVLAEKGAENFMSKFYVGYGHKSIGDMASITVFIEGVSLLAAKAIQDSRLYNGQEASTRYIDFTKQAFVDPVGTPESHTLLESMRTFYLHGLEVLPPFLKTKYAMAEGEKESIYDKAILARAFDIMRSFLPAGASTNLAWHGPVRVIGDRIPILRHHPLVEVRNIATALETALLKAHPNSFSDKRYDGTEEYLSKAIPALTYWHSSSVTECTLTHDTIDREYLKQYRSILTTRPPKTELPKMLDDAGEIQFEYLLDFGSYRDIQRHRAVAQRMPLLTTEYGFGTWYLDEMPEGLRAEAREEIVRLTSEIAGLKQAPEVAQYYTPIGFLTANRITGSLPALTYLLELRSGSTVHPTLRVLAQKMARLIEEKLADTGLVMHIDHSDTRFDAKRGTQDIIMK